MSKTPSSETKTGTNPLRKLILFVLVIVVLFALSRLLPINEWLQVFNQWIADMGAMGLFVFTIVYILSAILLLPGAILTLGAGFVFGLGWGFVVVSIGSTIGASLAFLIGRFLARDKIEAATRDKPKFRSIDQAIGRRGAKLIFLLRLSPLIPFNLSNYFYGLTAVPFWPYVLATWIGMMPGTLLYVYLGTLGRVGVEAAAGGDTGRTPIEWAVLIGGLVATLVVTIWISQIARNALKESDDIAVE